MNISVRHTDDPRTPGTGGADGAGRGARFYHPELDALRFIAFLLVFLHHTFDYKASLYIGLGIPAGIAEWIAAAFTSGGFGVDLFLLLSSYLITELLIREIDLRGSLDIRSFYIRRLLRIWPLYFFFLGLAIFVVPFVLPADSIPPLHAFGFLFFLGNWTTAFWGYPESVIAPLWSVSIEEQFYIVWPLLIMLFGGRHIVRLGIVLIVMAFIARIILVALGLPHPAIWATTFSRLDPIAVGAIIAVVMKGRAPVIGGWGRAALLLGGLAIWPITERYFGLDGIGALATYPLVTIACSAILLGVLCREPSAAMLSRGALIYLGRISYGLYVYHMLAIKLMQTYWQPAGSSGILLRAAAALMLTLALAVISYHALEQPFLRLKSRFSHVRSRDEIATEAVSANVVPTKTGSG